MKTHFMKHPTETYCGRIDLRTIKIAEVAKDVTCQSCLVKFAKRMDKINAHMNKHREYTQ